jgi:hypothetical protein
VLSRIFPPQFDNASYRGQRLAIWLFVPLVLVELGIGTNSIINTRFVAAGADGIPLASFNAGAQAAVVSLFALLGLCRVLFALEGVMVLIRYRSMVPFMYLLLLALHIGTKALLLLHPIALSDSAGSHAGSTVILAVLAALLVGLVLSLLDRSAAPSAG